MNRHLARSTSLLLRSPLVKRLREHGLELVLRPLADLEKIR